jgi:hypothetical protein
VPILIKSEPEFCIILVYVDDLTIIGNRQDIDEARNHVKTEFEMMDFGKTKFCLGLQLEHLPSGILVHQTTYIHKILEKFNMDKYISIQNSHVRSLNIEKDQFRPMDDVEEILGSKVSYLSVVGVLMYLANCTRPDIAFALNLLARHSATPTNTIARVKNIFRYLQCTKDLCLLFHSQRNLTLI